MTHVLQEAKEAGPLRWHRRVEDVVGVGPNGAGNATSSNHVCRCRHAASGILRNQ